jgi:D-amino-acid dehydrogenase
LFRTERDLLLARHDIALLQQHEIAHQVLDATAAQAIEPALSSSTSLTAALYLPQDEAGNCALFTKQLKTITQQLGATFHFGCAVAQIEAQDQRVEVRSNLGSFSADAVVLACGSGNAALMGAAGLRLPLQAVQGYSATCSIRDFEEAPLASLTDATYKTTITRFGNRIRIAGVAEPSARSAEVPEAAQRTLHKVAADWFPNATNYNNASLWSGLRPMLPDGVPLLGPTTKRNVYIGLDDGVNGWTAAVGTGKILADMVSARQPDIDIDGLTLSRYG